MTAAVGIVAGLLAIGGMVQWGRRIASVRVPEDRTAFVVVMSIAFVLGVAGLVVGATGIARIGAWTGAIAGALFVGLLAASKQDEKTPAVTIGGRVLDFTALDQDGNAFTLSSMKGRPFLLKFFRGHW